MNSSQSIKDINIDQTGNLLKGKNNKKEEELKDCIYTREELDVDAEIQLDEIRRSNFESTIKQLDTWDTEHLIQKKSNLMNLFKTFVENNFGNIKERWANNRKTEKSFVHAETTNSVNKSNSKTQLQSGKKSENKSNGLNHDNDRKENPENYPDFLDGEERDEICILLQNINIFRKKFDFSIFINNYENKNTSIRKVIS